MTIVLDTSVLIDHLRDAEGAAAALERAALDGERLIASVLTKIELLRGVRAGEEEITRQLLSRLAWIAVDEDLADHAGELARRYARSHQGIGPVDCVIAATAERLSARLWTRNVKHFPMFPDLAPPY